MALSPTEVASLNTIINREGSIATVVEQFRDAQAASKRTAAISMLSPAVQVTVSDWLVLQTFIQQSSDEFLALVMSAIQDALVARNASALGPMLIALYAAVRSRLAK